MYFYFLESSKVIYFWQHCIALHAALPYAYRKCFSLEICKYKAYWLLKTFSEKACFFSANPAFPSSVKNETKYEIRGFVHLWKYRK